MKRLALILGGLAVFGCALGRSPLATTWILDPIATRVAPATAATDAGVISVERVRVPDWLDRSQFVVRGRDGRVELDDRARWGEPLGRGLQRVVAENLASLLTERRVAAAPVPPRQAIGMRLNLDFVDAARQSDGEVRVEVRWEFQAEDGRSLRRGLWTDRFRAPKPGPAGTVTALNEALLKLTTELAETARALPGK